MVRRAAGTSRVALAILLLVIPGSGCALIDAMKGASRAAGESGIDASPQGSGGPDGSVESQPGEDAGAPDANPPPPIMFRRSVAFTMHYEDVTLCDVNGDGRAELLIADGTRTIWMYQVGSDDPFPFLTDLLFPTHSIDCADLNQNGQMDLLSSNNSGSGQLQLVLDLPMSAPYTIRAWPTGLGPNSVKAIGDLNRDGLPDLVFSPGYGAVQFQDPSGGASFTSPAVRLPTPQAPSLMTIVDVDGASGNDLLFFNESYDMSVMFQTSEPGQFSPVQTLIEPPSPSVFDFFVAANVDGSGPDEVVGILAGEHGDSVFITTLASGNELDVKTLDPAKGALDGRMVGLGLGDVTGDGLAEIVSAPLTDESGTVYPLSIFRQRAPLDFDAQPEVVEVEFRAGWILMGDMDGDGLADIVSIQDFQNFNVLLTSAPAER